MLAAGGVAVELGLVVAGIVVALAAIWLAARPRDRAAPAPAPAAPQPAMRRIAGPERRAVQRAAVMRPVVVRRPGQSAAEQRTFALDIGPAGALIAGPANLAVGDLLDLLIDLGEPIGARARVVREAHNGMKGVRFEAIAEADRDRLERFVREGAAVQPAQPG